MKHIIENVLITAQIEFVITVHLTTLKMIHEAMELQ